MKKTNKIKRAILFATDKHEGAVRKFSGIPYITHPIAVAEMVSKVKHASEDMIVAAILHDTVEDTDTTVDDIFNMFGAAVAILVDGLTDKATPDMGNRKVRKAFDRDRIAALHHDVHTIKLADIIHNAMSFLADDAGDFAAVWMAEKADLLLVLKKGDKALHLKATKLV